MMSQSMWRVAIIGAGPAGMYAADALSRREDVKVDIYDRIFAPYGLLRYGVAPDHPSIKNVGKPFDGVRERQNVRLLGGVAYGRDIDFESLHSQYHAVIFAVGAASDRKLGIPGEEMRGVFSSRVFVEWYNGHPDMADAEIPLDIESATVVGAGNVALDVARILVRQSEELVSTDIANHALDALRRSSIRRVDLLMRRGPADVSFTLPEIRELAAFEGVHVKVNPRDLELLESEQAKVSGDRSLGRILEVLKECASRELAGTSRTLAVHFFTSPVEVLGGGAIRALRCVRNARDASGAIRRVEGSDFELPTQLLISAIGYRGARLASLPFDESTGTIPSGPSGAVIGLENTWVTGWARRGPSGVIGTNKADAYEVANAILEGFVGEAPVKAPTKLADSWAMNNDWWNRVDIVERARGADVGRPRIKFLRQEDADRAIDSETLEVQRRA